MQSKAYMSQISLQHRTRTLFKGCQVHISVKCSFHMHFPYVSSSPQPKCHLDRFSRFAELAVVTDRQTDTQTRQTDIQTDRQDRETDRQRDKTDRQTDTHTDTQTHRQTDSQTYRQTTPRRCIATGRI